MIDPDDEEEKTTIGGATLVGLRPRPHRVHGLERVKGNVGPAHIVLKRDRVVLGRGEGSDIKLDSEEISRVHASFVRVEDEYQVEDLESRNGVHLNGLRVNLAVLREGDEVQLGDVVYRYQEGS